MGVRIVYCFNMVIHPGMTSTLIIRQSDCHRAVVPGIERDIFLIGIRAVPADLIEAGPTRLISGAEIPIYSWWCRYMPVTPVPGP